MIRLIFSSVLFLLGALSVLIAVIGVYKFRFVMNRMHSAAIIDTLGLSFILAGLMIVSGSMDYIPKLALILIIQWVGSPMASHMVARLEVEYDPELGAHITYENQEAPDELH